MSKHLRFFLCVIILHKLFLLACGAFGAWWLAEEPTLASVTGAWDSFHYLHLARDGYHPHEPSSAFYPLLPLLIRWTAPFFAGSHVWAALTIVNVVGAIGLYLFYRFVGEQHGEVAARLALLGLLAFPTALFFSVIYSESVFFLELMVLFWGLRTNRVGLSSATAFLMPLTRAIGLFVVIVLLWHWFEQRREFRDNSVKPNRWLFAAACGVVGWLAYLALMWSWTGDPFEGFKAQRFYAYQPSIPNIFNVKKWGTAFLQWGSFHGHMDSILDRTCFVVFLTSLYWIWKLSRTYFVWALCAGLVPALSSCFFSYVRYTLCVFPLFILLGVQLSKPRRRWIFWYYFAFLVCLQAVFMVRYVAHWWAG